MGDLTTIIPDNLEIGRARRRQRYPYSSQTTEYFCEERS